MIDSNLITISLDAMGGDNAPESVLQGAEIFLKKNKDIKVKFLIFGDELKITPIISKLPKLTKNGEVIHCDIAIDNHAKPAVALRSGKGSSMRLAIDSVKEGLSDAVISAGNTGALMAMSKLILRTLPGIDRPAIGSVFPTYNGRCVLLDLGANIGCDSGNLVQFAMMGDAFAKVVLNKQNPEVALLNVGEEQNKGSAVVKAAYDEISEGDYDINFIGYVEGDGIVKGDADVVVTDGFTGNIALKVAEGTGKICIEYIKQGFKGSPLALLGGLLARNSMKKVFKKMDPRMHNGAMFLGLNGISVKSHGGTDAVGFANALNVTAELVRNNINQQIIKELSFDSQSEDEKSDDLEVKKSQEVAKITKIDEAINVSESDNIQNPEPQEDDVKND